MSSSKPNPGSRLDLQVHKLGNSTSTEADIRQEMIKKAHELFTNENTGETLILCKNETICRQTTLALNGNRMSARILAPYVNEDESNETHKSTQFVVCSYSFFLETKIDLQNFSTILLFELPTETKELKGTMKKLSSIVPPNESRVLVRVLISESEPLLSLQCLGYEMNRANCFVPNWLETHVQEKMKAEKAEEVPAEEVQTTQKEKPHEEKKEITSQELKSISPELIQSINQFSKCLPKSSPISADPASRITSIKPPKKEEVFDLKNLKRNAEGYFVVPASCFIRDEDDDDDYEDYEDEDCEKEYDYEYMDYECETEY